MLPIMAELFNSVSSGHKGKAVNNCLMLGGGNSLKSFITPHTKKNCLLVIRYLQLTYLLVILIREALGHLILSQFQVLHLVSVGV
jgi:hypothetical protein